MNFSKNITLVLVCLTLSSVLCKCAPTPDSDALLAQILGIELSNSLAKLEPQPLRQEVGQVEVGEVEETEIEIEEIEETEEFEIEDDLDDEDWVEIWDPEGDDDLGFDEEEDGEDWIGDDDDWEDDFEIIDNKVTPDGSK